MLGSPSPAQVWAGAWNREALGTRAAVPGLERGWQWQQGLLCFFGDSQFTHVEQDYKLASCC